MTPKQAEAASGRALKYRTDPEFRARVNAELQAKARARTEGSRRAAGRKRDEQTRETTEGIDG